MVPPVLGDEEWKVLDYYEEQPLSISDHRRHLLALREGIARRKAASVVAATDGEAGTLERAEEVLHFHTRMCDPEFRAHDHPPYAVTDWIDVRGDADLKYLATVAWLGPKTEDQDRATALISHLLEDQRPGRAGYDPFGRLVVCSNNAAHYVVEWPLKVPDESYPDGAVVIASNDTGRSGGRAVYVQLPDGRLDLLPANPDSGGPYPGFAWGYCGTGPGALEAAIVRSCCEDYRDPAVERRLNDSTVDRLTFRRWLEEQVESALKHSLTLRVEDVRARYPRARS
jgi:hypothetical protein